MSKRRTRQTKAPDRAIRGFGPPVRWPEMMVKVSPGSGQATWYIRDGRQVMATGLALGQHAAAETMLGLYRSRSAKRRPREE